MEVGQGTGTEAEPGSDSVDMGIKTLRHLAAALSDGFSVSLCAVGHFMCSIDRSQVETANQRL